MLPLHLQGKNRRSSGVLSPLHIRHVSSSEGTGPSPASLADFCLLGRRRPGSDGPAADENSDSEAMFSVTRF